MQPVDFSVSRLYLYNMNNTHTLPQAMKGVVKESNLTMLYLMQEGASQSEAESMTIELMKECDADLKAGNFKAVENHLKLFRSI